MRERLGLEFSKADGKKLPVPAAANGNGRAPLSRAAAVAAQAEAAAREVSVSRRQADAQLWIAAWRSRTRGNKKAAAAAAAQRGGEAGDIDQQRLEQVRQNTPAWRLDHGCSPWMGKHGCVVLYATSALQQALLPRACYRSCSCAAPGNDAPLPHPIHPPSGRPDAR